MARVKSLRSHRYASERYAVGEEYEVSRQRDLKVLLAIGVVELVPEAIHPMKLAKKAEVFKQEAPRREVAARVDGEDLLSGKNVKERRPEEAKKKSPRGNNYSRRDLRAEEE